MIHQIIFRFYLLKYSLFFSSTLVLTSSYRRSLYTFYMKSNIIFGLLGLLMYIIEKEYIWKKYNLNGMLEYFGDNGVRTVLYMYSLATGIICWYSIPCCHWWATAWDVHCKYFIEKLPCYDRTQDLVSFIESIGTAILLWNHTSLRAIYDSVWSLFCRKPDMLHQDLTALCIT